MNKQLSIRMPELNLSKESAIKTSLSNLIKYNPKFKQLLESEDYKQLYDYVDSSRNSPRTRGYLTRLLYSLGIDPLLYMNYVPYDFLFLQRIPIRANIPDNISYLGLESFSDSGLIEISLPASLSYIDSYSFFNVTHLKAIQFRGTRQKWEELKKAPDWISRTTRANVGVIKCIDGEVIL